MYKHRSRFGSSLLAVSIVVLGLALSGCSKVNQQNYERLKMGMTYTEVVELLGEPTECTSFLAARNCTWGKEPKVISVQLVADKVILFQGKGL